MCNLDCPADGADRKRLQEKKGEKGSSGRAEGGANKDSTTTSSATGNSSAAKSKTDASEGTKRLVSHCSNTVTSSNKIVKVLKKNVRIDLKYTHKKVKRFKLDEFAQTPRSSLESSALGLL